MSASEEMMKELHLLTATKMKDLLAKDDISPQLLNSVVSFLKNNSITSDPSTDAAIDELEKTLREKKSKRFKPLSDEERGEISNVVAFTGGGNQ